MAVVVPGIRDGGGGFSARAQTPATTRKPPGQRPTEEVDRCVPQELSLDCCLENERVLGHTGRLLVDIHLLCWGLPGPGGDQRRTNGFRMKSY